MRPPESATPARSEPLPHFSQGGARGFSATYPPSLLLVLVLPVLLLVFPAVVLVVADRGPVWMPFSARVGVLVAATLAALWWLGRMLARAYRRGTNIAGLAGDLDPRARVNVVCWNDQRADLEPLRDVSFEPEQFRIVLPDRLPAWAAPIRSPTLVFQWLWIPLYMPILVPAGGWVLAGCAAVGIPLVLWLYRRPTYLRIAPGRVDIVREPVIGRGPAAIERLDVRSQPVRLDLRQATLHVGAWGPDDLGPAQPSPKKSLHRGFHERGGKSLPLWPILGRTQAARAIYLACISTAKVPEFEGEGPARGPQPDHETAGTRPRTSGFSPHPRAPDARENEHPWKTPVEHSEEER